MQARLPTKLLVAFAASALAACGGGGGGSSTPPPSASPPPPAPSPAPAPTPTPPPVNTTPPTAAIAAITPAQRVINQPVAFAGSGTTVTSGALTYGWEFGDGGTASGANATHNFATHGAYTVRLTVTDAGGLNTSATQAITVLAPPTVPTLDVGRYFATPNMGIAFTAASTDPQASALTYSWSFGDGATGSGDSVTHAFAKEGSYVVSVTATNGFGLTATRSTSQISVAYQPPYPPSINIRNSGHLLGQTMFATPGVFDPNGLTYTLDLQFGDGSSAQLTATSPETRHTYAAPGTYTVQLTATNSVGLSSSAQGTVTVGAVSTLPAALDNTWQTYCSGAFCGAASTTHYSGKGVGVWRYHNASNANATINVSVDGMVEGAPVTLVFSNGRKTAAGSVPDYGSQAAGAGNGKISRSVAPPAGDAGAQSHLRILEENLRVAQRWQASSQSKATPVVAPRQAASAAVPIGTVRTWSEHAYSHKTYNMRAAAGCQLSTGRNAVIWIDDDQVKSGVLDPARAQGLADVLCGPNGAYQLLVSQFGDVWGPAPADFVQDTATLQDLNIVAPGVDRIHDFGGYFFSSDLLKTSANAESNAAVMVFLNGWVLANYPANDTSLRNTLIHELKHLLNFYQRGLRRNAYHAAWLEETSAMLAEDMLSPRFFDPPRVESRIGSVLGGGGGISLIRWSALAGYTYGLGGGLGTFLHRRYGTSLDLELMTLCTDGGSVESSYDCIQDYIVRHGGLGFEDEFARLGASLVGAIPPSSVPRGFGLPGLIIDGTWMRPMGNYYSERFPGEPPQDLGGVFDATMHTFSRSFIAAGQTTYVRNGIVVPAGTTLLLVVAEPFIL